LYSKLKADSKQKQKESDAKRVMGTKPSLPLDGYTGKYTSDIYGEAQIAIKDGTLFIKYPNDNILKLEHWNYDIFKGTFNHFWWDKSTVQFILDGEGKVSQFEMDGMIYKREVETSNLH
jgi:hypothetical protein